MRLILLTLGLVACLVAIIAAPDRAGAQSLGSLFAPGASATATEADAEAARVEEIMRQARENGVGVVVIDTQGNMLSGAGTQAQTGAFVDSDGPESSHLMARQDKLLQFRAALIERILQLPNAFNEVIYILRAASPDGTIFAFVKAMLISLALFGVGMVVEAQIYGKRMAKRFVVARTMSNPQGYREKMPWLVFRFFMGVIGILVSMVVAYVLGTLIFGPLEDTAMQFTVAIVNAAYFFSRITAGVWRMVLSPYMEQYRIPVLSNRDAKRLHNWLWILATFDICAILFGIWIGELGLNYDVYAFLSSLLSALIVLVNILMVLVNRRAITNAIRGGKPVTEVSWIARVLSNIWAPVVILYVIFAWFELTYDLVLGNPSSIPLIAGAYGITMSIIVVYGIINYVIERSFERARLMRQMNADESSDGGDDAPAAAEADADADLTAAEAEARAAMKPRQSLTTFEALARRVAAILAFVAGTYAFFFIWDNNSARMVESFADRLLDVMVIIFIGYIVYHAFRIWIDGKIAEEQGDEEDEAELGDEGSAASSASRLATLLPLFRNFILILVLVTIVLIILLEVGINVGPLFAGAGVIGVAVGFGSQALVRDIFSGGFFLFDDAFRKGEYLDVGGVKGTVEKISVRSFQLRHHLGALHTIPFGEIQVMTNYSRDWVIMKLPLRVTYDTDVEKVRKLIKKLGIALLDDPVIGDNFIQPLKSQGVIEMQDSAMIIRVKFMTKPGDQWLVRKKVYEEIRALFEREGIRFAHREVTVRLADGKVEDLSEEERNAVTAAAQASIEEEMLEGPENAGGDDR
ncbi:mechanosensitive ion channel family protein [Sulfitobacter sabulilitoris]|uniref:Mechanosensitive ion channel family protein n=1 Tax=Sulfitobacter sabulilitoris TaxID=2562655 RepID=A0A5S3PC49_9RHOB|nr:mechanosensitive ion channel family protein [Sulfitobacter sabulilitoris]TMM51253.1 mechanosensitive ion channel family protein [Sulfitobacter sabulilitoris]